MKAERKHELEHNELDDLLVKGSSFLRENGLVLAIAAGVVVLAGVVYFGLFAEKPITADAGLWEDYIFALSDRDAKKELESLIDKEDKAGRGYETPVLWARLSLGDLKLAEGDRELFDNRDNAIQSLEEAEKNFLAVDQHAGRNVELRDRARIGLAKACESLSKPEEAKKYYSDVVKSSPDSPLGKVAARGERRMSQPNNIEFLAWFKQQKPIKKPVGKSPLDFQDPPEVPGFSLPPLEGSGEQPITPGLTIPSELPKETTEPEEKNDK